MAEEYDKSIELRKQGVELFDPEAMSPRWQNDEAYRTLRKLTAQRPASILVELRMYRKYVPIILNLVKDLNEVKNSAVQHMTRMESGSTDKLHQRWTPEEDNALIELACQDDMSILEMSTTMGRTVPAIKTRLSNLVGRKRLSQKVAGKFIGTIDGIETESHISGTVFRSEEDSNG